MEIVKIRINIKKEMRALYNKIKKSGLEQNGIIYGGMVRDEIISTYYKSLFDNYIKQLNVNELDNDPYKKYWDISYHPESAKRILIPRDMDIYFNNNIDAGRYLALLTDYTREYNGIINIVDIVRTDGLYSINNNFHHKKIRIIYYIGRTITYNGYKLVINIDMLINTNINFNLEPPYNTADFTCNLFIMIKNSLNGYDIRLSKNTGTPLDNMNYALKNRHENKIINDMLIGKTEFIRKIDSLNTEYINGLRILKMINNDYNITNVLFKNIDKINEDNEYQCDICLSMIDKNTQQELIEISTNKHSKNIMHKYCFTQYLYTEIYKKYRNITTNEIECRCTRRNKFDFKNSYKYSSLYL